MKRYYSLYQDTENKTADIYIYGDITSWEWLESDVSSYTLSKELQELGDEIGNINVYINSYGGEVAEGLAIYNALKRHKAKVTTYADGFACSIASVIFAAGDERIMSNTSLLMIHNAWTYAAGDSKDLRKQAEDLEKITQASINAYMDIVNIEEDELKEMMDNDTWLSGEEALEKGFATKILEVDEKEVPSQSIRNKINQKLIADNNTFEHKTTIEEEKIEEIVQKQIKELEEKLIKEAGPDQKGTSDNKDKEKPKNENKLNSFMKAFFNTENEEE
ncbi:Clp protease ClpP [Anaerosalibacter bizertensis]|uniref:head maturation protease, ClpP-related n=1 Tax=Anaerosalibacter bizertensis TaxID=932217 RepID=UPI001C0ECD60|nr:head maturation protease, ClpP-related [Anaerosalibacter bizertensis]MBU5293118.1 Clp protease ClpP [Anaerosalibacter bizertensis]